MVGNETINFTCLKEQYCIKRSRGNRDSEISAVSVTDGNFKDNNVHQYDMISFIIMSLHLSEIYNHSKIRSRYSIYI
jgi:hypothetical protein